MNVGRDYDVCDAGEVEAYGMDFVNDIQPGDFIVGATWTISDSTGTDPNPSARLLGPPWNFSQTITAQQLQGGLPGVSYIVQVVAKTFLGYTVSLWSHSRCEYLT